jgi:transposase
MAGEFWFNDEQWVRLKPLLPNKPPGVPRVDDRRVISGIVHVIIPRFDGHR